MFPFLELLTNYNISFNDHKRISENSRGIILYYILFFVVCNKFLYEILNAICFVLLKVKTHFRCNTKTNPKGESVVCLAYWRREGGGCFGICNHFIVQVISQGVSSAPQPHLYHLYSAVSRRNFLISSTLVPILNERFTLI